MNAQQKKVEKQKTNTPLDGGWALTGHDNENKQKMKNEFDRPLLLEVAATDPNIVFSMFVLLLFVFALYE